MRKRKNEAVGYILVFCIPIVATIIGLAVAGETALRWWAGLATSLALLGIPVAYLLGRFGAQQTLRGVDLALGKVRAAADQSINLRGQAVRELRQPRPVETPAVAVDPSRVVITHVEQAGGGVIEI